MNEQGASLTQAAKKIREHKEKILKRWELLVKHQIPEADVISTKTLRDSLPDFIDELIDELPNSETSGTKEVAKEHGQDRQENTNFSLDEIIYEYFILRDVIFDLLDEENSFSLEIQKKISKTIDRGIRKSAEQYASLTTKQEAKLRSEQEAQIKRLSRAIDVVQLGFFDWDIRKDKIYFSPKMQSDWGISAGTTLYNVVKVIHPDDQARTMELIQDSMKTGKRYFNQYRIIRSDGREIWIQAQGLVEFEGGEPVTFLGTSLDISEYKEQELRLTIGQIQALEREKYTRMIANSMPQIVWTALPDGKVDWYNERWYEYTGMKFGTNWDDPETPMHPEDIPAIHRRWRESYETGLPYELEYRVKHAADGKYRWHVARALPHKNKDGAIERWVGTITDIHAAKLLQEELNTEKNIRERFVSSLTHDLRTPLTASKMSAQTLERIAADPEKVKKTGERISKSMDRAERMIRSLLDVTRLSAGEGIPLNLKPTSLNDVLANAMSDLESIYGKRFEVKKSDEVTGVWDSDEIYRVFENLLTNGVKYGSSDKNVSVAISKKDDEVEVSVHNFGSYIDPTLAESLFKAYHRSTEAASGGQKGWGIGLTLSRAIVEAHQGTISVESSRDLGTTFRFVIPIDASVS